MSMVEVIVALAIVGLLSAIAASSYSSYIVRGQRSAAKAALLQLAQAMERYYTACGSYSNAAGNLPASCTGSTSTVNYPLTAIAGSTCDAVSPPAPANATYCISGTAPTAGGTGGGTGGAAASTYLLTATPCGDSTVTCPAPANASFQDSQCDALTLDNAGNKGADNYNTATNQGLVAQCWQM
jgi:type IV pilus assembly protein PilE